MIDPKALRIRFSKIDGFIRFYDGTRGLVLSRSEKYHFICNRIRYLIGVKIRITYVTSHNYAKIKVDSYDSLPFHNIIILIKPVFNKDKNKYYYHIFLEKFSLESPKK